MRRPYYIFSGGRLRRSQHTLVLDRDAAGDGAPSRVTIPVASVESLYLFGEISLNTRLVTFLARAGIPALFFDYFGNYTAALTPREPVLSGRVRLAQARSCFGPRRRLRLARAFVSGAAANIGRNIAYYAKRAADPAPFAEAAAAIRLELDEVASAGSVGVLMAAEGRIREHYYRLWPGILGPRAADFPFEQRRRRPPSNEMNALISFGNALCYTAALRQIHRTALDPTLSFLHEPGDRRFSLALDLAELFKPLLVDRSIFRLVKTRALTPAHFESRLGGCYLNEAGRKIFVGHWDERLRRTIRHRDLGRPVSYERLMRLECHKLVRGLLDPHGDPYKGFRMWW